MKKQVLIIGILALFMFSCSNEEATNFEESNLKFERKSEMTKFLKSEEFKNYLSTKNKQSNDLSKIAGNNSDNGKMILQSPWGIAFGAVSFSPTFQMTFIGGDGAIEELPNGRAKFSVHTNNPWAFHSSDTSLSSDCVDGSLGTFNYSLISEYTVEVIDFGGGFVFTFYNPTGDGTATSGNGHCKVSDAQPIYDYETWEILGCTEATIYKTISIKGNAQRGFSLSLN